MTIIGILWIVIDIYIYKYIYCIYIINYIYIGYYYHFDQMLAIITILLPYISYIGYYVLYYIQ